MVASPNTYVASLGAMLDSYARLGELFISNPPLGDYARLATRLKVVSLDGKGIRLAGGRILAADGGLDPRDDAAIVYLPAFQVPDPERLEGTPPPNEALTSWLQAKAEQGALICASGASAWHLARAGLLENGPVSVGERLAGAFRRDFPSVKIDLAHSVSTTGMAMTCGSEDAEWWFVVQAFQKAGWHWTAQLLALRRGPALREDPSISGDPLVARAQLWIQERHSVHFRIGDLAHALGVSHQSLIQRFHRACGETPRAYIQRQRIESATMMLRETDRTIAEIAGLVGYSDIPSFRQAFVAKRGLTPSTYRRTLAQKKMLPRSGDPVARELGEKKPQ